MTTLPGLAPMPIVHSMQHRFFAYVGFTWTDVRADLASR